MDTDFQRLLPDKYLWASRSAWYDRARTRRRPSATIRAAFPLAARMPYFHDINPIAMSVGPLAVHWYGIMYLLSFAGAWWLGERRRAQGRLPVSPEAFSDLAFYVMVGVILGGRIWYMLSYVSLDWIVHDPVAIFRVWDGGMSFHGGLIGVLLAGWLWSRRHAIHFFDTIDFVAPLVPIGLGVGGLGNFINVELWGKQTEAHWAG